MNEKTLKYHLHSLPFTQFQVYVINTQASTRKALGVPDDADIKDFVEAGAAELLNEGAQLTIPALNREVLQFPPNSPGK